MKKTFLLLSGLLLSVLLTGQSFASDIGFIDTVKIFQESKHGKNVIKTLEELNKNSAAQIEALIKQKDEAEKANDQEKVNKLNDEINALAYILQTEFQQKQEAYFAIISTELSNLVNEYRAKKNLAVIFNHSDVITFDPAADITNDIMQEFNQKEINLEQALETENKE